MKKLKIALKKFLKLGETYRNFILKLSEVIHLFCPVKITKVEGKLKTLDRF